MTLALDVPPFIDSPLHRLDPRWKLAAWMPTCLAIALIRSWAPALAAFALTALLVLLSRLPSAWIVRRLGPLLLLLLLLFGWLPWIVLPGEPAGSFLGIPFSLARMHQVAVLLFKTASIVTLALLLIATTRLENLLKAAHALHLPGMLIQILLLAYRYIFLLSDEFSRLRIALRVRGYRNRADLHSYRTISQVAGTLLIRSEERAERVRQAMLCRGFDGTFRTLAEFRTRLSDLLFFAMLISLGGSLLAWDVARAWIVGG